MLLHYRRFSIALQKIFQVSWSNVPTGACMYFAIKLVLSAEPQYTGRVGHAGAVCVHTACEKSVYRNVISSSAYLSPVQHGASQN